VLDAADLAAASRPVEQVLAALRRRFTYRAERGRRSLDELLAALRRSAGQPVPVNCLTLCCVLASALRSGGAGGAEGSGNGGGSGGAEASAHGGGSGAAEGSSPEEVFVAVGGRRGLLEFHAWVLVRRAGGLLWIAPETLRLAPADGAELWRGLALHLLFNDVHLYLGEEEKRRLLAPAPAPTAGGWRLVLYGPAGPAPDELALVGLLRSGELARELDALDVLGADGSAQDVDDQYRNKKGRDTAQEGDDPAAPDGDDRGAAKDGEDPAAGPDGEDREAAKDGEDPAAGPDATAAAGASGGAAGVSGARAAALACGLLAREGGRVVAGRRLVIVPAAEEERFRSLVLPALGRYLEVIGDAVPRLRRAYAGCAAAGWCSWAEVCHAVVAGMLMDLEVGRHLPAGVCEEGPGPRVPVVWAFERPLAENAFGVQSVRDPESGWSIAQLWHAGGARRELRIDPPLLREVGRIAGSAPPAGGASSVGRAPSGGSAPPAGSAPFPDSAPSGGSAGGAPPLDAGRGLLWLRHHRLVAGRRLRLPAFAAADWRRLEGALQPAAAALVAEAVGPALAALGGEPFWTPPRRLHAAVRLLLEAAADHVVAAGLLPSFPPAGVEAPGWGRWLWEQDPAAGSGSDSAPRSADAPRSAARG
jgi:hypothetical protein